MTKLIATAFIASAGLALVSSAQAMPIAPLDQPEVGAVIQVFGGCGWGGHRGPWRVPSALQLPTGVAYRTVGPRLQTELVDRPDIATPPLASSKSPGT
jgi:hypothetical protein